MLYLLWFTLMMMNAEKIEEEKKLDVIDIGVIFIVIFRIIDDFVVKNKNHIIVGLLLCLHCYLIQSC